MNVKIFIYEFKPMQNILGIRNKAINNKKPSKYKRLKITQLVQYMLVFYYSFLLKKEGFELKLPNT